MKTMASPCSEMHESVNSSHDNGNARVEEISEYGVEPLITIRAMTFCQQRVNSNGQNFENLLTDESQVQIEERTKNSNMEEQTSAPTSDESGFEESYQIGVDSTTITFTSLDNEEQSETGPQVKTKEPLPSFHFFFHISLLPLWHCGLWSFQTGDTKLEIFCLRINIPKGNY